MADIGEQSFWDKRPRSERQEQRRAVDAAERIVQMFGPDEDAISRDGVEDFIVQALSASRFDLPDPVVSLDLHRPDVLAEILDPGASDALIEGQYRLDGLTRDRVIHLHPERISRWTALHELAVVPPQVVNGEP